MNIKTKDVPERTITKYNYLKSIKDKENTILSYYKKVTHLHNAKPKPLQKPKKRTKKNISKKQDTNSNDMEDKNNLSMKEKEKEKEKEKLTKKKIVIMD